jgi:PAS domain S-box-containing protein
MIFDFKKKILGLCVFAAIFFWLLDATLDWHYKSPAQTLFKALFSDKPIHEFYERILVFIIWISLGCVFYIYTSRIDRMANRYSNLFSSISDAIFILNIDDIQTKHSKIIEVNKSASVMFGYQTEELLQLSFEDLLTLKRTPEISSLSETLREDKHIVFEAELARKDGGKLVGGISIYRCDVSGNQCALLIVRDITAKKRNEEALQESERELRILATQLLNAQETERQRISVELHDELGQALMHLKFKVGSFIKERQKISQSPPDACNNLLSCVDEIIEYVRRLSRELSPSVLEELGLTYSIQYLVEEFCDHYHMCCNSNELDQIDQVFSFETQLNVFRIFQECLTNVARHAQATGVSVAAKRQGDHVLFMVEDDGKGFDVKRRLSLNGGQRGIGISAMQQRVRMLEGSLEVRSAQGTGTRVSFTIPLVKGA